MHLAVNKLSGLRALRQARATRRALPFERCDLFAPDPSPQVRWTGKLLPLDALGLNAMPNEDHPLAVAVPSAQTRLQARFVTNTVYTQPLLPGSFVELGNGIAASCPELTFIEAATYMTPMAHVLLGYELCGTYARDARDPRCGDVTFGVQAATSVKRISDYIESAGPIRGIKKAKAALELVRDNAWSPMEAIVAALAMLPMEEGGYGLGDVALNNRKPNDPALVSLGCRESRVPDIELVGTHVGFNYDGHGHFSSAGEVTDVAKARSKYLDDVRRNRELAAMGRVVLPVTSEDLFQQGGLDAVMLEAVLIAEELDNLDSERTERFKTTIRIPVFQRERQRIIWSVLPWEPGGAYAHQIADQLARMGHAREVIEAVINI